MCTSVFKILLALSSGFPFLYPMGRNPYSILNLAVERIECGWREHCSPNSDRPVLSSIGLLSMRERASDRARVRESTRGIGITLPTFPSLLLSALCISETSNFQLPSWAEDRRMKEGEGPAEVHFRALNPSLGRFHIKVYFCLTFSAIVT